MLSYFLSLDLVTWNQQPIYKFSTPRLLDVPSNTTWPFFETSVSEVSAQCSAPLGPSLGHQSSESTQSNCGLGHPLHPTSSSASLTHASLGQQPVTSNSHLMINSSQVQSTLHDYSQHCLILYRSCAQRFPLRRHEAGFI